MDWKCFDGVERDVFREVVTESIGNHVLASRIEEPTEEDLKKATETFQKENCKHEYVFDDRGFYYDFRACAFCGAGRGTV